MYMYIYIYIYILHINISISIYIYILYMNKCIYIKLKKYILDLTKILLQHFTMHEYETLYEMYTCTAENKNT